MAQRVTPRTIGHARRRAEALELRASGETYQGIADKLYNGSRGSCHRDLARAFDAIDSEPAAAMRSLELDRLDRMTSGLAERAFEGDTRAVTSMLRIMERRAKMLGLDADSGANRHSSQGADVIQVVFDGRLGGKKRTEPDVQL